MSDFAPIVELPVKGMKSRKKTLVLVRHAQSNENVKVNKMFEGLTRLRNFKAPTFEHIRSTFSLSSLTIDSLVSPLGKRQILDMHMILRDETFWARQNFDLVVCSPLTRAKETCEGIFPKEPEGLKMLIRDDLEEATPYEHLFNATLLARIERFKHWLASCDEERILIVGHSQYFKKMLGLTSLMRNCDVWQCDFASDEGNQSTDKMTFEYTNLNLLYRTNLSEMHPYDKMTNSSKKDKINSKLGEDVDNDLREDEPVCRICQTSLSEAPTLKLIKPCKCSGSAAYVHLNCLNKWRETSRKANQHCAVCNYHYVVKKSDMSELLLSERTVLICAILVYVTSVIFLGIFLQYSLSLVSDIDIVDLTLIHMDIGLRWRYFRLIEAHRSELIRSLFERFEFITIYDLLLCNETAFNIMNTLIVGQLAVCMIGAAHSVTTDLIVILREGRRVPTTQSLFLFVAVAVNKVFALRVWVPVHGQYVSNKIYQALQVAGRSLSASYGEEVQEYSEEKKNS